MKKFYLIAKYHAHPKLMTDLWWSLNPNILPDILDLQIGFPWSTLNNDQITHNISDPAPELQSSCADLQPCTRCSSNSA